MFTRGKKCSDAVFHIYFEETVNISTWMSSPLDCFVSNDLPVYHTIVFVQGGLANFTRCLGKRIAKITAFIRLTLFRRCQLCWRSCAKKTDFTMRSIHGHRRRAADGNTAKLHRLLTKFLGTYMTSVLQCKRQVTRMCYKNLLSS